MELLYRLAEKQRLRFGPVFFYVVVCHFLCSGFVIDLGIESENINSSTSTAFKRFPFELNEARGSTIQTREKVIEFLSRDFVEKTLLTEWENLKEKGLIRTTRNVFNQIIKEEFASSNKLAAKEVLYYLQFFPLLYNDVNGQVDFHISIDGNPFIIRLQQDGSGTFTAFLGKTDLSNINAISIQLNDAFIKTNKPKELPKLIKDWAISPLDTVGISKVHFPADLDHDLMQDALLKGVEFLLSTSILRKSLPSSTSSWLQQLHFALESDRIVLDNALNDLIQGKFRIPLRYELTANMVKTSDYYRGKWQELVNAMDIHVQMKPPSPDYTTVTVKSTDRFTIRDLFKLLQYSLSFGLGSGKIRYKVPIGDSMRTFYLSRALFGQDQILVHTHDSDWPNTYAGNPKFIAPDYDGMVNLLKKVTNQRVLAQMMVQAIVSTLKNQRSFETDIQNAAPAMTHNEKAKTVRAMVEFMIIAMAAEAAAPSDTVKYIFMKNIADGIQNKAAFPGKNQMPNLGNLGEKSGRSPTVDDVVLEMLNGMRMYGVSIDKMFSEEFFPIRKTGGTQEGREYVYNHGDMLIPSYLIKNSARDIAIIARKSCTRS